MTQQAWHKTVKQPLPSPAFSEKVALGFEHWHDALARINDTEVHARATSVVTADSSQHILSCIFGNSPFLSDCILKEIDYSCTLLEKGPDWAFKAALDPLKEAARAHPDRTEMAKLVRITKRRAALAIALADICGTWSLEKITDHITTLAETTLDYCVATILREGHQRGYFTLKDPDGIAQTDSGFIVLGMGKMGGRELNYSSDIDLIILFDPERIQTDHPWELQQNMVRLTKFLVQMMDERTPDGYVFRTDLRLRPDPGSTPLALSVMAAETYYESIGQNWERAAMIKARPVAGDLTAGYDFLDHLRPFMWRKYMDFAAIQDIHAIKRQINAHKGGHRIAVNGHNVKLGHGGIREIEFYAQTQQLIWGGRLPDVRIAPTCKALQALVNCEQLDQEICDRLTESYRYLRTVEHRLQMIHDEQTHSIPEKDDDVASFACFMGYETPDAFAQDFLTHLQRVESDYAALFDDGHAEKATIGIKGNLVFTGGEPDPETLTFLTVLGFDDPAFVDRTVRGWHHARYRATRSTRAREILTDLMPSLIKAMAATADPDQALRRFDDFLSKLPAGVQLFSLLHANPHLLDLVAEVMGEAPRLADYLGRHPTLLEYVLTPDFFTPLPPLEQLRDDLETMLRQARDYQDVIDLTRRWTNDRKFQIGVQTLRQIISIDQSGLAQSDVAQAVVQELFPHVQNELAQNHGIIEGGDFAIIGLGKVGSQDMTATSDLDLVFVYHAPEKVTSSTGPRAIGVTQYYARLAQRFINALSAPTGEGLLYEVDMRLRPSGNAGPIASRLDAFVRYYGEQAWTWEHMALTKARVLHAGPSLTQKLPPVLQAILAQPRDQDALRRDIADMRQRMDKEHHTQSVWKIKHYRGGTVDVDFIAQYLQLAHAHTHPDILKRNSLAVLHYACDHDLMDCTQVDALIQAAQLWSIIQGYLRLTVAADLTKKDGKDLPNALKNDLVIACEEASFDSLCARMQKAAQDVLTCYTQLIENTPNDTEEDTLKD